MYFIMFRESNSVAYRLARWAKIGCCDKVWSNGVQIGFFDLVLSDIFLIIAHCSFQKKIAST